MEIFKMEKKKKLIRFGVGFFSLFVPIFFIPILLDSFKEYVLSISMGAWCYGLITGLVMTRIKEKKETD
ncbi:hypothetical protein [Heliophilum fasciatum]|uniref:Uncharacterized protein n=1 Tax=Heliophilum fasciatum TaxID=35700 RepID=A0A4R2RCC6_9FIRM|nr:hypothetical protein [Heliophilum fasciatum]MCW2279174.1 hypothetical protein [Heliophilum fasciatum]TCP61032.1 hypothetical protein EDD73_13129 [Heliophilum fasciatum]